MNMMHRKNENLAKEKAWKSKGRTSPKKKI